MQRAAGEIAAVLREILHGVPRVDMISVRAKSVERFLEKARREVWQDPLRDIQDQIGARVVVFYKSDVDAVAQTVLSTLRLIEDRQMENPDPRIFGYQGKHFLCAVPPDICARAASPVDFFELQVSTLFQHAWAEAEHDLGYKLEAPLDYEERRKIAWAAAQAWGCGQDLR
ncbi:MAG: RelA/SpoT domain-containing protein [Anaerolineae bacterium]|nr:RelA/SpoT domain-containing protein [Anaerolineae bacterium]